MEPPAEPVLSKPPSPSPAPAPRELPLAVTIAAWAGLACIPLGVLVLCSLVLLRHPRDLADVGVPLLGVGLLFLVCVGIIAEKLGRARWRSRYGRACTACGYDMSAMPDQRCPECGQENAALGPYDPLSRDARGVSVIRTILGLAVLVFLLAAAVVSLAGC